MKKISAQLTAIMLILLASFTFWGCGSNSDDTTSQVNLKEIFKEPSFTFQLLRTAGGAPYGTADIDECTRTAQKITDGDIESWYTQWYALAVEVENGGKAYENQGNTKMAREAYIRASNYYRNSGFFLSPKPLDPRAKDTWDKSVAVFRKAAGMFSPQIEYVEIPYENTVIPAYYYRGQYDGKPLPTIIIHQGFDGTKEESIPGGLVAQQNGYNCIIFEGPGQGEVIHNQGIPFRPDWEKVVEPVVDYLLTRPEVDSKRIGILGFSMGGYLAPRAATEDSRLSAVIANGGVYDVFEGVAQQWIVIPGMPTTVPEFLEFIKTSPDEFNEIAYKSMDYSIGEKWSMVNGMYTFGVDTPAEYFIKMSEMTLDGRVQNIKCPTLVIDSENDKTFPGQPQKLYKSLTCEKTFLMFTAAEGADLHCQVGAAPLSWEKTYEWLNKIFLP
jgi:esterase/lipase